jgi:hypothetical protein
LASTWAVALAVTVMGEPEPVDEISGLGDISGD